MEALNITTTNPWGGPSTITVTPTTTPPPSRSLPPRLLDIGLLKSSLLPSLTLSSSLSLAAYAVGRATDRLDTKDIVWPLTPVLNAWWAAVFRHTVPSRSCHLPVIGDTHIGGAGVSLGTTWRGLSGAEKTLLGGVTLWGGRLFYRVLSRALKREGCKDGSRYEGRKRRSGVTLFGTWSVGGEFWNWAWLTEYVPAVMFSSIISLPVTTPFRLNIGGGGTVGVHWGMNLARVVAVGLFSAGVMLEVLADQQLAKFEEMGETKGKICRDGVWDIVRHPNYLGECFVQLSWPLFLYANDMLAPIALLGPFANHIWIRFIGGVKATEESQARRYGAEDIAKKVEFDRYRRERNAFWPDPSQIYNKWSWIIVGCGVAGVVADQVVLKLF